MKLKHVVLTAIAATLALGFASCGPEKNDIPAPTIKVKAGGSDIDASTEAGVPFEITLKTDDKTSIESYTLTWKYDETRTKALTPPAKDAGGKSIKGSKEAIINITSNLFPEDATTGYLLIQLKDKNNGTANREQKTKVKDGTHPTPQDGTPMKDEKTGYLNHAGSPESKGCYDLNKNQFVSANKNDALIPERYMINNSPEGDNKTFNPGWSSKSVWVQSGTKTRQEIKGNGTLFKKADPNFDYAKATVEQCAAIIAEGGSTEVEKCAVGEVYVAKKGEELYVIKIVKIDEKTVKTRNTGHIEFVYKRK